MAASHWDVERCLDQRLARTKFSVNIIDIKHVINCIGPIITCCWPFVMKLTFIESSPALHVTYTENRSITKLGRVAFIIPFYR